MYLKRKKKSTHPSDQKKVNCWDGLMIRTNAVSTLKSPIRRTGTNRGHFYSALIFTLGGVCAKPSRFSDWRQTAAQGRGVRKEGRVGGCGQRGPRVGVPLPQLRVQQEQCWERQAATPRSAETDRPHRCYSPPHSGFSITFTHSQLWTAELYVLIRPCDFKGKHKTFA